MKTDKRVATVGEKVYDFRTGRTEIVESVHNKYVAVIGYPKGMEAVACIAHEEYEVIST